MIIESSTFAAFEYKFAGARNLALGNATIACRVNQYAIFYNTAGIPKTNNIILNISYKNYFNLQDLNLISFVNSINIKGQTYCVGFSQLGNRIYHENRLLIGYSFSPFEAICVGVNLNYYSLSIKNYGACQTGSISFGFLYKMTNYLDIGIAIHDLNNPKLGNSKNEIKSVMTMGFCYNPVAAVYLYYAISRNSQSESEYKLGLEYNINKSLDLRFGFEDMLDTVCSGFGFDLFLCKFDYAFRWHYWLGPSHALSLKIVL